MVVCPVCEHAQAGGWECEVCGRLLQAPPDAALAVASAPGLDGLEPTRLSEAAPVAAELVPGLEPTGAQPVERPREELIADLERTGTPPVDPPISAVPDVERVGDDVPGEEPTPYPAVVVCRYCRTEAAPDEKLCSRCGMRLPTARTAAVPPGGEAAVRFCSCGTPVRGPRCPACGARTP